MIFIAFMSASINKIFGLTFENMQKSLFIRSKDIIAMVAFNMAYRANGAQTWMWEALRVYQILKTNVAQHLLETPPPPPSRESLKIHRLSMNCHGIDYMSACLIFMSGLSKSLMSNIIMIDFFWFPRCNSKMQKRMKYFNLISLMFSLSASITINKMKLEMAPPIWDQLNCNSFKLNHISSILKSYFLISRVKFLQFQSRKGRKFWTENRPCSNLVKFLGQLWTFQWNSNVSNWKVKAP